jgi:hypothetical protein
MRIFLKDFQGPRVRNKKIETTEEVTTYVKEYFSCIPQEGSILEIEGGFRMEDSLAINALIYLPSHITTVAFYIECHQVAKYKTTGSASTSTRRKEFDRYTLDIGGWAAYAVSKLPKSIHKFSIIFSTMPDYHYLERSFGGWESINKSRLARMVEFCPANIMELDLSHTELYITDLPSILGNMPKTIKNIKFKMRSILISRKIIARFYYQAGYLNTLKFLSVASSVR